ncbi:helix-turn-helix domain-containing protein [Mesorhizobium australafricanum]|uniref:Helix-turn-helix domain-containing protein n=1 Tax=Mesorhizobium australafricanum TaxID=3072311 RepID=A0ABU4WUP5_9HYPH|nr:helix-turn-helix domain-containing protein [Mesorhizobium sp. VK3E]MDX8439770.1 helix-turn-helix domain-containing protein [Mesorhizobium sp. VK3E]
MDDRTEFDFVNGRVSAVAEAKIDVGSVSRIGSRLAAWRDYLNTYYYPLDLSSPASLFEVGRLSVQDVASIRIGVLHSDPMTVERHPTHIGRYGEDFFMMPMPSSASLQLTQRGRECEVRPGDLAFIGTGDPYVYKQPTRNSVAAIRLPADMVRARIPWIDDMTALQRPKEQPLVSLFQDFLRSMVRNGAALSDAQADFLRSSLFDLLALALTTPGTVASDETSVRFAHRQRVLRLVEERVRDPGLTSAVVAHQLGLSPRYLQKIFADRGETLTEVIRRRRISEAQRLLKSGSFAKRSIEEISYCAGFLDAAYFSRVFRQETGMSPGEYRRMHAGKSSRG